jgi:hypothetical protein
MPPRAAAQAAASGAIDHFAARVGRVRGRGAPPRVRCGWQLSTLHAYGGATFFFRSLMLPLKTLWEGASAMMVPLRFSLSAAAPLCLALRWREMRFSYF